MFDETNNNFTEEQTGYNYTPSAEEIAFYKKQQEKKDLRKTATVVGVPCLVIMAIGAFWSTAFFWITTKLGIGYKEALEFASSAVMGQVFQIVISILMFTVPFICAARIAGYNVGEIGYFGKPREKTALPYLLFGIGFCAFANVAVAYASTFFESFGVEYEVDFGDHPEGFFGFLLTTIATAIVPALVEELACRGIMIGLLKKHGDAFAVIVSAILFGVMHGNFEQIPFAFLVGLVLGFVYVKTESIWICVAIHFTNNFISVLFSYMPKNMDAGIQDLMYTVYLIAALLLAVLGIVLINSKTQEDFEFKNSEMLSSEKEKYKWFFTNAVIIAFIVLNLVEAASYFV